MKNDKILLLYDVTSLLIDSPSDGMRAGQYFVAYNLLMQFLRCDKLHIVLYSDYHRAYKLNNFIKQNLTEFNNNFSVYYINSPFYRLALMYSKLLYECAKEPECDNLYKKFIRFTGYKFLHYYDKYFNNPEFYLYNAFFSPTDPISVNVLNSADIKKYLFLHDTIPIILKDFYKDKNLFNEWFLRLEPCLHPDCTYFVNSKCTENDFLACYPFLSKNQFTVAYLGASERFKPCNDESLIKKVKAKYSIPEDKKFVFLLSSFDPRKNFFFAMDNFIEFIKQNNIDDVVLVMSGAIRKLFLNVFNNKMHSLPEDMKSKIFSIGYVDDADIPVLLSGALTFAMPSVYEGFGMPILEAMKCGCPVICSNTSAMPEVIGDCGIMINPANNQEMADAYKKMYFDDDFRNTCIKKGLERAETFTWENCAEKIIKRICRDFFVDKK